MDYISGYPFTLVLVYVVPVFTHGRSMRGNEMPAGLTNCERMSDGFIEGGDNALSGLLGFSCIFPCYWEMFQQWPLVHFKGTDQRRTYILTGSVGEVYPEAIASGVTSSDP